MMMNSPVLKTILGSIRRRGWLLCLALGATVLLVTLVLPTATQFHWRRDWSWYDLGWYGRAPLRTYHSFNHSSIGVRWLRQDARCSRDQLFLATRGSGTEPGAHILDHEGELVWRQPRLDDETHDFRVQQYKGQSFLTFWAGKADKGAKLGSWYMMDETYTIKYHLAPAGGYTYGDMHEFQLTQDDTALITVYPSIPADLRPIGGAANGFILDGVFQELDIETGRLLFQWNASSHVPLHTSLKGFEDCSNDPKHAFVGCGNTRDSAFDYYHINSVQKDTSGNYLVSARHTSSLTYVDGKTGQVLWTMGGKLNDFSYTPNDAKKLFSWQHHARLHNNTITLLDNNAYSYLKSRTVSRGLSLEVNVANRSVAIQHSYKHPQQRESYSQGNVQRQESSGNVLVGWGNCAAFTEFSAQGEILCDSRFAAAAFFSFQPLSSYRVYRGSWIGRPTDKPSIAVSRGKVFVSWNGATEVAEWQLQGADEFNDQLQGAEFDVLRQVVKTAFETEISLETGKTYRRLRVAAVDKSGSILRTSDPFAPSQAVNFLKPMDILSLTTLMVLVLGLFCIYSLPVLYQQYKNKNISLEGYEAVELTDHRHSLGERA